MSTSMTPSRAGDPNVLAALAARVHALGAASSDRVLIGITGSPGAGKTTLAQALVAELNRGAGAAGVSGAAGAAGASGAAGSELGANGTGREFGIPAVHLPMDGFHLANATLDRLGLRERKGAIETFDGWGFVALLERVRRETDHTVFAPAFERTIDESVSGEIAVEASARYVVVEGNYLLDDSEPWRCVRDLLNETWFCDADDDERMLRLVRRHTEFGRTPAAAKAWAAEVDGANARRIAPARASADVVVSGVDWTVVSERGPRR